MHKEELFLLWNHYGHKNRVLAESLQLELFCEVRPDELPILDRWDFCLLINRLRIIAKNVLLRYCLTFIFFNLFLVFLCVNLAYIWTERWIVYIKALVSGELRRGVNGTIERVICTNNLTLSHGLHGLLALLTVSVHSLRRHVLLLFGYSLLLQVLLI